MTNVNWQKLVKWHQNFCHLYHNARSQTSEYMQTYLAKRWCMAAWKRSCINLARFLLIVEDLGSKCRVPWLSILECKLLEISFSIQPKLLYQIRWCCQVCCTIGEHYLWEIGKTHQSCTDPGLRDYPIRRHVLLSQAKKLVAGGNGIFSFAAIEERDIRPGPYSIMHNERLLNLLCLCHNEWSVVLWNFPSKTKCSSNCLLFIVS